jgi:hypothetical protein
MSYHVVAVRHVLSSAHFFRTLGPFLIYCITLVVVGQPSLPSCACRLAGLGWAGWLNQCLQAYSTHAGICASASCPASCLVLFLKVCIASSWCVVLGSSRNNVRRDPLGALCSLFVGTYGCNHHVRQRGIVRYRAVSEHCFGCPVFLSGVRVRCSVSGSSERFFVCVQIYRYLVRGTACRVPGDWYQVPVIWCHVRSSCFHVVPGSWH